MTSLLFRKWFHETWTNLGYHAISSAVLIALSILPFLVPLLYGQIGFWFLALVVPASFPYFFATALVSRRALAFADFAKPQLKEFFKDWKQALLPSLFLSILAVLFTVVATIAAPYYFARTDVGSIVASILLVWSGIAALVVVSFFMPVYWRLERNLWSALRRTVLIVADNPVYCFLVTIAGFTITAMSAVTAFLIPGLASVSLWYHNALRLRLHKYVYLEQNPEAPRGNIPWSQILKEDSDRVATRSRTGPGIPLR